MSTLLWQYLIQGIMTVFICLFFWVFIICRDNFNDDDRILKLTARHNLERSHWHEEIGKLEEQINRLSLENARLRQALYIDTDPTKPEVTF